MSEKHMDQKLKKLISTYFWQHPAVSAAYIYGSYATGTHHPQSDVDIAILFADRNPSSHKTHTQRIFQDLSRQLRKELHIVALNDANNILLEQIFTKGDLIVVNDPKHLALFKMRAFAEIADFGHIKQITAASFIKKLSNAAAEGNSESR